MAVRGEWLPEGKGVAVREEGSGQGSGCQRYGWGGGGKVTEEVKEMGM